MKQMRWLSSLILALFGLYLLWTASPKANSKPADAPAAVQEQAPALKPEEIQEQHPIQDKKQEQKIPTHSSERQKRENMELLGQLSTKTQAQNSLRDLHDAADSILKSAVLLGDYKEKWMQDPSLKPQALGFYQDCAANTKMAKSIRATCWSNAVALSAELKTALNDSSLTRDIKELAKHLSQTQN